jgi:hypothetical protein
MGWTLFTACLLLDLTLSWAALVRYVWFQALEQTLMMITAPPWPQLNMFKKMNICLKAVDEATSYVADLV